MIASGGLSFSGDCMLLAGEIDFLNVVALQRRGDAWLQEQAPPHCRLDMGGVTRSNSAGTALLLAWLRTAAAAGKQLTVEHPPESLVALMDLAGLERVLNSAAGMAAEAPAASPEPAPNTPSNNATAGTGQEP